MTHKARKRTIQVVAVVVALAMLGSVLLPFLAGGIQQNTSEEIVEEVVTEDNTQEIEEVITETSTTEETPVDAETLE